MPAALHISQTLNGNRFAIIEENETQEPNGLVKVALTYSVAPSYADSLLQHFFLDAAPPVFPATVNRASLQGSQGLYMLDFSTDKANGLWTVSANYVGARNRSLPFFTQEEESRVTPEASYYVGVDFTAEEPPRQIPRYDVFTARFTSQSITTEIASAEIPSFDRLARGSADGLLYRFEYGTIIRSKPNERSSMPRPSPKDIVKGFNPYVEISTSVQNVTNRVFVSRSTRYVVLDQQARTVEQVRFA
jgi:hypothetical protein